MIILSIRTDKPEAEAALLDDDKRLGYVQWPAHRQMAATLHAKIRELLRTGNKTWHDIDGIVVYQGPGSFTGLRIGISVANALAYALGVPVAAGRGDDWISQALKALRGKPAAGFVVPEYGGEAHITPPKK